MVKPNPTKSYYDKKAGLWMARKTDSFHHEKQFTAFAALLHKGDTVIDIGCAGGIHVPLFLGIGRHLKYLGVDISQSFLKVAQRRYPQLTFLQADIADRTTLPKKKFSGFIAAAVLMHVPLDAWDTMFENIEHITKSGAIGYISLPVAHPSGRQAAEDPRHFTLLDNKAQRAQLTKRGWKILKSGSIDGTTTPGVWRWYIVQLP